MSSTLNEKLGRALTRNDELISILSQTDYAGGSLSRNNEYIQDLRTQLRATEAELAKLHGVTDSERKEHLKYRESTSKRLFAKLGGSRGKEKHASRLEKEERDFLEAWQREREAQDRHDQLTQALANAEEENKALTNDVVRHDQAQSDLDALYDSIFGGPTPEVANEDSLERNVSQAKQTAQQAQSQLDSEKRALDALRLADRALEAAYQDIQDALKQSERDMFLGSTLFDMMERDALSRSQNNVTQALRHLTDAVRFQPAIRPLSNVNIDQGHFISDVMFDNIFTDMNQHSRIEASEADIGRAIAQLRLQIQEQGGRMNQTTSTSQEAERSLSSARQELQSIRAEVFQQYANKIDVSAPPPPY